MATEDGGLADALLGGAAASAGADTADAGGGDGFSGGGDGGVAGGGAEPEWLGLFSADGGEADSPSNRDWLKAKGFKTPDDVAKSYRAAEKAIHGKGMVAVPGEGAKPEEISAFRAAIGVPEKAADYEIAAPEGVKLNDPFLDRLRESALTAGVPKAAFGTLVNDYIQAQLDDHNNERQRQDGLRQDWVKAQGANLDASKAAITTAMRALDLSVDEGLAMQSALGPDRALTLLTKLGSGMSEDVLTGGGKGRFGVSAAEAQAEIDRLRGDAEWVKKATTPGTPENARYSRLNQASAEGRARAEAGS